VAGCSQPLPTANWQPATVPAPLGRFERPADCLEILNHFIVERIRSAPDAAAMLLTGGLAYIEYAGLHPQEYHLMFNMEPSQATSGEQRQIAMRSLLEIVRTPVPSSAPCADLSEA
jgi:hypothetical protein